MKKYFAFIGIIFLFGFTFWYATLPEEAEFDGERYVTLSQATQEDCIAGEEYDSQSQSCFIICTDLENCIAREDALFAEAYGEFQLPSRTSDWEKPLSDEDPLVRYTIDGEDLVGPNFPDSSSEDLILLDESEHQELWDRTRQIIPNRFIELYLEEIIIFSDGIDETLAYVEPVDDTLESWALGLDPVDMQDPQTLEATIVHELAHLLSLHSGQIDPDGRSCHPTYEVSEGCVLLSSYLARFFDRFWLSIYDEWLEVERIEDEDEYYEALDMFYIQYQNDFVSDYAVTNPEEDFAESFMVYILGRSRGLSDEQREKVEFFSQFPEFEELKRELRAALSS